MTVDRLEKTLNKAASVARSHAGQDRPQPTQRLKALLRPDFDRVTRLADEADMIDKQMATLVEGQAELLECLEGNSRMVIEGGAGTGKTLLAVEAARRRSGHGERILFTCRSGGVVAFARKLLDGTDVKCIPFDELGSEQSFDVVVVDEAQDILNFDDLPRLETVIRGGIESGSWWIFVDTNNQAHVDGAYDPELFDQMRAWSVVFRLRQNCRNTEPIVTQIQTLLGADLGVPRVGAGPKVGMLHARSDSAAVEGLDRELERLLDQGVNLNEVAIISLQSEPADSLAWGSRISLRGDLGDAASTKRVKLWSPQQIKGLESKHVLVVDVHDLLEPNAMQKLYVAMTRARVSLWMAIEDPAWNQLGEMAAQSIQGRTA
jgi:DNA helicase IV